MRFALRTEAPKGGLALPPESRCAVGDGLLSRGELMGRTHRLVGLVSVAVSLRLHLTAAATREVRSQEGSGYNCRRLPNLRPKTQKSPKWPWVLHLMSGFSVAVMEILLNSCSLLKTG